MFSSQPKPRISSFQKFLIGNKTENVDSYQRSNSGVVSLTGQVTDTLQCHSLELGIRGSQPGHNMADHISLENHFSIRVLNAVVIAFVEI
jgi:hypothetical protein